MLETIFAFLQVITYFIILVLAGYRLNRGAPHPLSIAIAGALVGYALIQADSFTLRWCWSALISAGCGGRVRGRRHKLTAT